MRLVPYEISKEKYLTNSGEEFIITKDLGVEDKHQWFIIEFTLSGNERRIRKDRLIEYNFQDIRYRQSKYLNDPPLFDGKECYNKMDEMFIIVNEAETINKRRRFNVRFPYTGYETVSRYDHIIHGKIADKTEPDYSSKGKDRFTIGDILTNAFGVDFKVIRFISKNINGARLFEVEFLLSGNRAITRERNILNGRVNKNASSTEHLNGIKVGNEYENNYGEKYKIIEYLGADQQRLVNEFKIRFENNYETIAEDFQILKGTVENKSNATVYGIGYLGNAKNYTEMIYKLWNNMISRCYSEKDGSYYIYGGAGVRVCDRWLCFENFVNDLPLIDGYDEEKFNNGQLRLDKDKKQLNLPSNQKVYSLETCTFISNAENMVYRSTTRPVIVISPDGTRSEYPTMNAAQDATGVLRKFIRKCINGEKENHKGYIFIEKEERIPVEAIQSQSNLVRAMTRVNMLNMCVEYAHTMERAMTRLPKENTLERAMSRIR